MMSFITDDFIDPSRLVGRGGAGNLFLQVQDALWLFCLFASSKTSHKLFDFLSEKEIDLEQIQVNFILSGSRESNPGHTVPNRVHYHYATPRGSEGRAVAGQPVHGLKMKTV